VDVRSAVAATRYRLLPPGVRISSGKWWMWVMNRRSTDRWTPLRTLIETRRGTTFYRSTRHRLTPTARRRSRYRSLNRRNRSSTEQRPDRWIHPPAAAANFSAMTTHTSMNALDTGTAVHITPINHAQVALVLNAGTDAGLRTARELLRAGYRVAVTGRHVPT
jgi:hypothetical protein